MKLGVHVSSAGDFSQSLKRGENIGCEGIQIFTSNPKGWNFKIREEDEIKKFQEDKKVSKIEKIFGHSIYLTNLASSNPYIYTNSVNSLISGLTLAHNAGFSGVVTHIGSYGDKSIKEGKERVVNAVKQIMEVTEEKVPLLLETDSGSGHHLGGNFQELGELIKTIGLDSVKVCLDTCHVFVSGYDISTKEKMKKTLAEFDKYIGLERLALFHLNDSKGGLDSKLDRHEEIGKGYIGKDMFEYLVNERRFKDVFGIVETPDNKDTAAAEKLSLDILKELRC